MHPFIVHFPIALLTLYAICELVRFKNVTTQHFWFHLKAFLVITGSAASILAIGTGEMVADMFREMPEKNAIVPVHAILAEITSSVFLLLAISYAVLWAERDAINDSIEKRSWFRKSISRLTPFAKIIAETPISLVLAFTGIIGVTLTGALGGAMVHGIDSDPFITFFYRLFF